MQRAAAAANVAPRSCAAAVARAAARAAAVASATRVPARPTAAAATRSGRPRLSVVAGVGIRAVSSPEPTRDSTRTASTRDTRLRLGAPGMDEKRNNERWYHAHLKPSGRMRICASSVLIQNLVVRTAVGTWICSVTESRVAAIGSTRKTNPPGLSTRCACRAALVAIDMSWKQSKKHKMSYEASAATSSLGRTAN